MPCGGRRRTEATRARGRERSKGSKDRRGGGGEGGSTQLSSMQSPRGGIGSLGGHKMRLGVVVKQKKKDMDMGWGILGQPRGWNIGSRGAEAEPVGGLVWCAAGGSWRLTGCWSLGAAEWGIWRRDSGDPPTRQFLPLLTHFGLHQPSNLLTRTTKLDTTDTLGRRRTCQ